MLIRFPTLAGAVALILLPSGLVHGQAPDTAFEFKKQRESAMISFFQPESLSVVETVPPPLISETDFQMKRPARTGDLIGGGLGAIIGAVLAHALVCGNLRECDGIEAKVVLPGAIIGGLIGAGIGSAAD